LARFRPRQQEKAHDLDVDEFLRRFLLHLLPPGFVRIRNFGSSPTAIVLRCCRSASNCSTAQRR